jgi:TonB family protein
MFTQLLASQPVRQKSTGGLAASMVLHLGLATALAYATTKTIEVATKPQETRLYYLNPEPPPAQPADPTPPVEAPSDVGIVTPTVAPPTLPPISRAMNTVPDRLFPGNTGEGMIPILNTVPRGLPSGIVSEVFREDQVEIPVALAYGSAKPGYPASLSSTGIEGAARFRFVVDTVGRVEMTTIEMVSSSHAAFAQSVRITLPRMRFTPARVDGKPVRQLVELPFEFRTKK